MTRRPFALVTLIGWIGVVGLLSWVTVSALGVAKTPVEQKVAAAERVISYRIDQGDGPRFWLTGEDRTLRLVTHVVLGAGTYDPDREVGYGLVLEIFGPDGAAGWRREVALRSRQSKGELADGVWLAENTFSLEGEELSDDRTLTVDLPACDRCTLAVSLRGEAAQGLLRVFTRRERGASQRELRLLALSPTEVPEADRISTLPWSELGHAARLDLLRYRWERLPASGESGRDYETHAAYVTGFRLPGGEPQAEEGSAIGPDRDLVVNLTGPARVTFRARPRGGAGQVALLVQAVGESAPAPAVPLSDAGTFQVPEGPHSVVVSSHAPAWVAIETEDGARLAPELRRMPAWLASPGGPPVLVSLDGPADDLSRTIRVEARALGGVAALVRLEFLGAAGDLLAEDTVEAPGTRSRFERFERVELLGDDTVPVAEPVAFAAVAPAGSRTVRITASGETALRVSVPIEGDPAAPRLEEAYRVPLARSAWRYAPVERPLWLSVRPTNHGVLREGKVHVQVRLEPVPERPLVASLRSIKPVGGKPRMSLDRAGPGEPFAAGSYTALPVGQVVRLRIPAGSTRRPTIVYRAHGDDGLGATAQLELDGRATTSLRVGASRGTWRLPRLAPGAHTVAVRGPSALELLIDVPSAAGGALKRRALFALGARPLELRVRKDEGPRIVNMVVCAGRAGVDPATRIQVQLDGGAPPRSVGRAVDGFTRAVRSIELPAGDGDASIRGPSAPRPAEPYEPPIALEDGGRCVPRVVAIALGEDLAPGTHRIVVTRSGTQPLWVRFFMTDTPPREVERAFQWRVRDAEVSDG